MNYQAMLTYKSLSGHDKGSYRQSRQYIRLNNINLIIYFEAVSMQDKKPIFWKVFKKQTVLALCMRMNENQSIYRQLLNYLLRVK